MLCWPASLLSSVAGAVTLGKVSASPGGTRNRSFEPDEPVWFAGPHHCFQRGTSSDAGQGFCQRWRTSQSRPRTSLLPLLPERRKRPRADLNGVFTVCEELRASECRYLQFCT